MNVAITGAGGMLARALGPALAAAGHDVTALDRATVDVTQLEALRAALAARPPAWIFHLAAFAKVDECESRADHAYLVNGLGARNAALIAAEMGAAVLMVSTDYVFDGRSDRPYREYDPTAPRTVYGASKRAGEQATRDMNPRHLIVRTAWLYGRGGPNFPDTILERARSGQPLRVVDDQRGSPTWTEDLAPALVRLAETGQYGTYHCTSSEDCTWYEFARHLIARAGIEAAVTRTDTASFGRPAPRPAYSVLSNLLYEHVTGHRMPSWRDAADRYLASLATPPVSSHRS
jgi:dTDP-4-dehydrorhamnose reductase